MKICTCNNCGNIYEDTNPQIGKSIEYPDFGLTSLEIMEKEGEYFIGCPECEDDGYLTDNININALNGESKRILMENKFGELIN